MEETTLKITLIVEESTENTVLMLLSQDNSLISNCFFIRFSLWSSFRCIIRKSKAGGLKGVFRGHCQGKILKQITKAFLEDASLIYSWKISKYNIADPSNSQIWFSFAFLTKNVLLPFNKIMLQFKYILPYSTLSQNRTSCFFKASCVWGYCLSTI